MTKRETAGKISLDLLQKSDYLDHSAHEQMQHQLNETDFETNMMNCMQDGIKKYPSNFYIVVQTKKEPKLSNILRNYYYHRWTCPTPTYDNAVFRYHRADECLEFLWVLPSKATYNMMKNRPLEIPAQERELLQFVLDDADGTLLKICKTLNGELK